MIFIWIESHFHFVKKRNNEFERKLGERVRKLRDDYGWSQEELASIADIEPAQVSRVERGVHSATLKTIVAIALALGKYPHELLDLSVDLPLNQDFTARRRKAPKTITVVAKLIDSNFFHVPRSVADTVHECKKLYRADLINTAVSAILKELVERRKLMRVQDPHSRRYLYKMRTK